MTFVVHILCPWDPRCVLASWVHIKALFLRLVAQGTAARRVRQRRRHA